MSSSETLPAASPLRRAYLGAKRAAPARLSTRRAAVTAVALAAALWLPSRVVAQDESLADEARRAYAELRLEDAWSAVARALAELDVHGAERVGDRAEILVLAAAIARARGDEATADAMLDRLLEIAPDVVLDPALHPPPLLEALERRRRRRAMEVAAAHVEDPSIAPLATTAIAPSPVVARLGEGTPHDDDPWPWVGGGIGAGLVLGGVIVVAIVFTQPPSTFELRGTIAP